MRNNLKFAINLCLLVLITACGYSNQELHENLEKAKTLDINAAMVYPEDPKMIRTPKGANALDLETPLRCYVNWGSQQIISSIPYNLQAFHLVTNGSNDMLPRCEVTGFSFPAMSAEKALRKLTKEAGRS